VLLILLLILGDLRLFQALVNAEDNFKSSGPRCCLEGWANAALYIRLTGLAECHIMAVITNVAMIITMAVVIPCQAITPT
jgi:hypothetical protein